MKYNAKIYLKVTLNLLTALAVLLLCIFLLPRCIWFFMPFIMGWIISLIASPVVRFFEEKLKVKRKAMSAVVIVAVLAVVVLLVYLLIAKLIREGVNFFHELPNIWNTILAEFHKVGANLQVVYDRMPTDVQTTIDRIILEMGDYIYIIIHTHRYTHRHTHRHIHRERYTHRDTDTDMHTETYTHRHVHSF